ncbi:PadR family transcriptional regulator [candidate division KSB1 bacterium]
MDELSKTDEIILITIFRMKNNAYGVTIRRKIEELTGKLFGYGTLYSALDQLLRRRYVVKITGEPTSERGGRRKYYYRVTKEGAEALKSAQRTHSVLWSGISESVLDEMS